MCWTNSCQKMVLVAIIHRYSIDKLYEILGSYYLFGIYLKYYSNLLMQIIANGKPRFISLSTSILGGESVLNDINYLHSPGSKLCSS